MAGKDKGRSTIVTAEDHKVARLAAQARKRGRGRGTTNPVVTAPVGVNHMKIKNKLEHDRKAAFRRKLDDRGIEMIDLLGPVMKSTNPVVSDQLSSAVYTYVMEFVSITDQIGWPQRHKRALAAGLAKVADESARAYARKHLSDAYYKTCPPKRR